MKKRIVLCADDYGQALAISQGIITLIQQKRLTAVSCMVNTSHWPEHASWLLSDREQVDIGLHFNLTEGKALSPEYQAHYGESFFSLSNLMAKALLRQLNREIIAAELRAQMAAFSVAARFLPDFIDGHQHVHQFPIIREALLQVYEEYYPTSQAYIRLVNPAISVKDLWCDPKKLIICFMGTAALKQCLINKKIPHNTGFAGIYSFNTKNNFTAIFSKFLQHCADRDLIMCHPGLEQSRNVIDAIATARMREYSYFNSEQFIADSKLNNIEWMRFQALL